MSQYPPTVPVQPDARTFTKAHRAGTVLTLGILSLVLNFGCAMGWILGIIAWVMGKNDLREMDAGTMDPSGRSNTQAGKVCGMISVVLAILGALAALAWFSSFAALVGVAAAGAGAGGPPH